MQYVKRTWWRAKNATGEANISPGRPNVGAGERSSISDRSFRTYLQRAFFYFPEMPGFHSSADVGDMAFPLDGAQSGSRPYNGGAGADGPDLHLLIYDAQRGDPDFVAENVRCVAMAGNVAIVGIYPKTGRQARRRGGCAGARLGRTRPAGSSLVAGRRRQTAR